MNQYGLDPKLHGEEESNVVVSDRSKKSQYGLHRPFRRLLVASILTILLLFIITLSLSEHSIIATKRGLMFWADSSIATPLYATTNTDQVIFGMGIGDASGPIVQTNFMGYASLPQVGTGLHIRQRARAFIVGTSDEPKVKRQWDDEGGEDPNDGALNRWVFVNGDICMGDTALRRYVVEEIRKKYMGLYGERNIAFVGTHSHSGPGGYINALAPQITSLGIINDTIKAIVAGSVNAISIAHQDFETRLDSSKKGNASPSIFFDQTTLRDAHRNRSPSSYLLNPEDERSRYDHDQDDDFYLLRFEDSGTKGIMSFYPVHGTSLFENNTLSSSDNKGLASLMVERKFDPASLPGRSKFVAAFVQANVGDTSPNTQGAFCDSGTPCNFEHSTCKNAFGINVTELCHGRPPTWGDPSKLAGPTGGWDWSGNEQIAELQAQTAQELLEKNIDQQTLVSSSPVRSVKWNIAMSNYSFTLPNGTQVTTCPAAFGYGFAGGTTDGPGAFDFQQGANNSESHNPFWDVVKTLVSPPSAEQVKCQGSKRILLSIGEQNVPYPWGPGGPDGIVETQVLRVGSLFILVVPGEFTTMAGRRIKEQATEKITQLRVLPDGQQPHVVLSGPANTYGHYVATPEEYEAQRYEAASTLFGPHTLDAYLDIYINHLIPAVVNDEQASKLPKGRLAPLSIDKSLRLGETPVVYDNPPPGHKFGDVLAQPSGTYSLFQKPNVTASFVGANPRNDLRLESTYFEIQKQENDAWTPVRTDGHHSTTMRWTQTNTVIGSSQVDVAWNVEDNTPEGDYRIVYYGASKTPFTGKIKAFNATTTTFSLSN